MGCLKLDFFFNEINEIKSFSLEYMNRIQVDISSTNVHVLENNESDKIKLHLHGISKNWVKLDTAVNNNTFYVKLNTNPASVFCNVALDIYIPKQYEQKLTVNMSSGNLKMDSVILSDFTSCSNSGELSSDGLITEKISIKNSSGNVILKNCNGNIEIKSGTGKVSVSYDKFEDQNLNIETKTGNISVQLPVTAEFTMNALSTTGIIRSDFSFNNNENADNAIEGEIGSNNNTVLLKTSAGNIKILKVNKLI